jgi:hypothetical protein
MKALALIMLLLISGSVFANSTLTKLKEARAKAVAKEQEKFDAAVKKIDGYYVKKLEYLMKALTKKGDLEGAMAVKAELDSIKEATVSKAFNLPNLKGTWKITYSNRHHRVVEISKSNKASVKSGTFGVNSTYELSYDPISAEWSYKDTDGTHTLKALSKTKLEGLRADGTRINMEKQ